MQGQEYEEASALTLLALDLDLPAMKGDHLFDRGETQAEACTLSLRREERFENTSARCFVHPHTGVLDTQDELGHGGVESLREPHGVRRHGTGRDAKYAAVRHGVTRIEAKVHEHLMELGLVAAHREARVDLGFDVNGSIERVTNQAHRIPAQTGQIHRGVRLRATTSELEDAARQLAGLRRSEANVLETLPHLLIGQAAFPWELAQVVDASANGAQ